MLKRILASISAGIMTFSCCAAVSAESGYETVETDVPPKLLILGDSIATGYGLEGYSPEDKTNCSSYANLLSEEYSQLLPAESRFSMNDLAIDGQTSAELLEGLNSGKYDELLDSADCIVVSIGGNDLLGVLFDVLADVGVNADGSEKTTFDLKSMLVKLKDMNSTLDENIAQFDVNIADIAKYIETASDGQLIIQTQYDPLESFDQISMLRDLAAEKIKALNEKIISHSADDEYGYFICDNASAFKGKAEELTNIKRIDIHPNADGHKLIAKTLDEVIRSRKYSYQRAVAVSAPAKDHESSIITIIALIGGAAVIIMATARIIIIKIKKKNGDIEQANFERKNL